MSMGGDFANEWANKKKEEWVFKLKEAIAARDLKLIEEIVDEMENHYF